MKTLLQINTSIFSDGGQSSRLAERFVAGWREANPGGQVVVHDLAKEPVPHIDAGRFGAFLAKPAERTSEQQRVVDYSDALIDELKRADVIVLGLPMYNFGVPSTLKAYFDHVARAGVTFRYTETGPGRLADRQEGVRVRCARRVVRGNAARHANAVRARFPRASWGWTTSSSSTPRGSPSARRTSSKASPARTPRSIGWPGRNWRQSDGASGGEV